MYESYAEVFAASPGHREYNERLADFLPDLLGRVGVSARDVLDVACGVGDLAMGLARRGYTLTGVDLAPAMIDIARQRAAAADLAAADAASQAPPPQPPDALQAQRGLALAAIGGDNRRTALLALAERHRLARCVDLLLCADEPQLIAMTERVAQNAPADAPDFAWRFERALWRALVPALQRDELPPGLASALLRHLGALGSDPTTLETVLGGSGDADAFLGALRQENLLALEDRDPAVRVHAHDWLAANGAAVPDYEPMAPRAERRRALRKFAAAAANAPTEGR